MSVYVLVTGDPVDNVRDKRGDFVAIFQQALGEVYPEPLVPLDGRQPLPGLPRDMDALIITGSSANVPTRDAWILRAEAFTVDAVRAGVPTLGVCFGHQMLGHALGGVCTRNPRGREMGTVHIERLGESNVDPLLGGLPETFKANVTHLDTVAEIPPGATVLARSEGDDHQAIRFTETCWGVQFHPEIDDDVMRGYIEARREILTGEGRDVDAMLASVEDAPLSREVLRRFVRRFMR